jgi:N-acetylglucosaminyl-diphospho-decaprenol L-rhamnosyltransferase
MVDIVIVNWNSGLFLKTCTDSILIAENETLVSKIIIIDNNSSDDSVASIQSNSRVEWILNKENLGFSRACNQGFKKCTANYVLLLNPDAKLTKKTISESIVFMDQNNHIDILGCTLFNDEGKVSASCSRFPTPLHIFYDVAGLSKVAPKIFTPGSIMADWKHNESKVVDQVMGAFMFMRKGIFEKIGFFDERFFVYYEDVDFSKRLKEAGGQSYFNTSITANHTGGGTTHSVKAFRLFLNLQSRLIYAKKYFSTKGYAFVWSITFFIEPFARIVFLLMRLQFVEIKEVIKGFKLLIRNRS